MDPYKYLSGYALKMQEENKSLDMLKYVQFGREIFTLNPVAYITVDVKVADSCRYFRKVLL